MPSILHGVLFAAVAFASTINTNSNEYAKQRVLTVYKDYPSLNDVAFCESTFRQYVGTSTEVLRGTVDHRDVGIMQINEYYNGDEAKRLGYDIYSVDGNLEFALYRYKKNGLRDWSASFPCMNKRAQERIDNERPKE